MGKRTIVFCDRCKKHAPEAHGITQMLGRDICSPCSEVVMFFVGGNYPPIGIVKYDETASIGPSIGRQIDIVIEMLLPNGSIRHVACVVVSQSDMGPPAVPVSLVGEGGRR